MRLAIGRTNLICPHFEDFRKDNGSVMLSIFTYYFALHFTPAWSNKHVVFGPGYLIIEFSPKKEVVVNG
jgi:hypothetical protein